MVNNKCIGLNMNIVETYNRTECKSDKEYLHKYISSFYDGKIGDKKTSHINILEIGIQYGYSLKLWEDYFTNANIYGIDIANQLKVSYDSRVHTEFMNGYSDEAIRYFKNLNIKFDIIIDDGPHTIETQNYVCKNYKQFLNSNGILIIEDVHLTTYEILHSLNPEFNIVNLLEIAPAYNDSIIMYYDKEN